MTPLVMAQNHPQKRLAITEPPIRAISDAEEVPVEVSPWRLPAAGDASGWLRDLVCPGWRRAEPNALLRWPSGMV